MNFQHISLDTIRLRNQVGGVRGLVAYNERVRQEQARQAVRYIEREGGHRHKNDLVEKGGAHFPRWANDALEFFALAEQHAPGPSVAWKLEVGLPRELSAQGRERLAEAIRETYFSQHPYSWAMHNPVAGDGEEQPHLHMVISMKVDDGIDRPPAQWFRHYRKVKLERSGAYRYDTFSGSDNRSNLLAFRKGIERLTNQALELEGQEQRIWAGTVHSLGVTRQAAQYISPETYRRVPDELMRAELARRRENGRTVDHEQEVIRAEWYQTKQRHCYQGLTMGQAVLYERERFYANDKTPWRERERAEHQHEYDAMQYQRTKTYERQRGQQREREGSDERDLQDELVLTMPTRTRGMMLERERGEGITMPTRRRTWGDKERERAWKG